MAYENLQHTKAVLGITGSTWDTFITAGISHCSVLADQWMYRDFAGVTPGFGAFTRSMDQRMFITGNDGVLLRSWPVQSIIALTHTSTLLVEDTHYSYDFFRDSGWVQFIDRAVDGMPLDRWGRIDVAWVTGYSEANLPETLRGFVRRGVSYLYQRRMQEGVGADLIGDTQVTFRTPGTGDNSEMKQIFNATCGSLKLDVLGYDEGTIL